MDNKGMVVDANYCLILAQKCPAALQFAEQHIKSGKPWDRECEKTIGEALPPKPPKRHGSNVMQMRKPFFVKLSRDSKAKVIQVWWPFHLWARAFVRFRAEA